MNYMWNMINYEVCGRGHFKNDIPCQDKTKSSYDGKVYVIALADGAGSAKYSHYGAETIVNTISRFLSENFENLASEENALFAKEKILNTLLNSLKEESIKRNCNIKDLASTLLAVAIKGNEFLVVHLGDGVIGVIKNDVLKVASKPENGQYANVTTFVTSSDAIEVMKIFKGHVAEIDGFILMSDGTAESLYHKQTQTLSPATKNAIDMSALLVKKKFEKSLQQSLDTVIKNNTQDDCSIAIISRKSSAFKIYSRFTDEEKCEFFQITGRDITAKLKKLKKYELILNIISNKTVTLQVLSKLCHIKRKYLKRKLKFLIGAGVVECHRGRYYSTLEIEKYN